MRIRKRTPARAASLSFLPVPSSSATEDVPKQEETQDAVAAAGRCSRNDGKRWRCKKAAVPGYLFCDRHIAWSTRKRKPRASTSNSKPPKTKSHGSGVPKPTTVTIPIVPKEFAEEEDHGETQQQHIELHNAGF